MSTHDYILANQVGSDTRVDLNLLFQAIVSQNSSATEPATMYAYMFWFDTTAGYLKQRNSANTAWTGVSVAPATTGTMAVQASQIYSQEDYLINGNFDQWQYSTSNGFTGYTTSDRWLTTITGTTTVSRESTDIPVGSRYASKWTTGAAASYAQQRQYLISADVIKLRGQQMVASMVAKCSAAFAGNISFEVHYSTASDAPATFAGVTCSPVNTGQVVSSGYTQLKATFTVPANAVGLYIGVVPSSAQASGEWVMYSQMRLNKGSYVFEYQPKTAKAVLEQCEEFYQLLGQSFGYVLTTGTTAGSYHLYAKYKKMRSTPTPIILNATGTSESPVSVTAITNNLTAAASAGMDNTGGILRLTGFTTSVTAGNNCMVAGGDIGLSSELV